MSYWANPLVESDAVGRGSNDCIGVLRNRSAMDFGGSNTGGAQGMKMTKYAILVAGFVLTACGQQSAGPGDEEAADDGSTNYNSYAVLGEDLQQLIEDFNANEGRVRLMFLSGPTCGICLRGMADLNDAFIAESQNDDRLVTFVVHVPTLGAKEEHVADTIPLLNGPKVHHYWEESGVIGSHFTEVMEVGMYVWDFWAIYGPDARWEGTLPPKPDYYEHQLGVTSQKFRTFPKELVLDAERFASKVQEHIDQVDVSRFARESDLQLSESELQADGTVIPVVAQPRNVAVSQHIRGRGGYKNLKRIQSISKRGRWLIGGSEYSLQIDMQRPDLLTRRLISGDQEFISEVLGDGTIVQSDHGSLGLPVELEETLLSAYEFDGPLIEWPGKGSELAMIGMLKIGGVLAWKLDLTQSGGQHWHLYINSHGGALVKADLLGDGGRVEYSILQGDVRETDGFKYPHRIEYQTGEAEILAVEIIDTISIVQDQFELSDEPVTH